MSLNINNVTIAGNLTREPQTKFLAGDRCVCEFGIAVNRQFKGSDGEKKEETTFVECVAWGRTAELVGQYLTKGAPAYVEGRLTQETWEDKESGQKRSKTKVTADRVQFLGGKREPKQEGEAKQDPAPQRPAKPASGGSDSMDEAPFMRLAEMELG